MNHIRRWVAVLATLAGALLAFVAATPAALATVDPPGPAAPGVVTRPVVIHTGGIPGWQVALIATGAALVAAVLAVLADRAWTARRHVAAPSP